MRYPIYIPSVGRARTATTPRILIEQGVEFSLVVEDNQYDDYAVEFGSQRVLSLSGNGFGHVFVARNFIKKHSQDSGFTRHWQLDDNIKRFVKHSKRKVVSKDVKICLGEVEDFVDRYQNIGMAGLAYTTFGFMEAEPYLINKQCASCFLVDNRIDGQFRRTIEDTDYSLQVLTKGYSTIVFYEYLIEKAKSGVMKGGGTDGTYAGDGRYQIAKSLMSYWPAIDKMIYKKGVPKVYTGHLWRKYKQVPIPI